MKDYYRVPARPTTKSTRFSPVQVAAVIPGGGMLNAFISGFIKGARLQPSQFDAIIAHSSAAHVSALFIAGQIELSKRIWVDELTKPGVFSFTNVLKGKRPANVDFLVDECCRELDIDAVIGSRTKLVVSLFRRRDGKNESGRGARSPRGLPRLDIPLKVK